MRFPCLIILCLFLPLISLAQYGIITGVVTHSGAKTPLARASVFLSNSSIGSATTEDGTFTLSGIRPGQYELVVTILGYEDYSKTVLVGREPIKLDIELIQKPLQLREVVITSNADWKRNYEVFKRDFIGIDENAKKCKVVNPHVIDLVYNKPKQAVEASSDEFLIVENGALGYRVKFLLKDFSTSKLTRIVSYEGRVLFEDLPGSETQKKIWHQKREDAYYGSTMHFYRSLYAGKMASEGFVIRKLLRIPNPLRRPEELIQQKIKMFNKYYNRDSLNYWIDQNNMVRYRDQLVREPMHDYDILRSTGQQGIFAMTFKDYLYVVFTKKREETDFKDLYRPLDMENFETSVITLYQPYALFDMNGVVISSRSTLYEGTWSKAKLSTLLPVDYVPDVR
jgi:hypothetical protein